MSQVTAKAREPGAIPVPAEVETLRWLCRQFRRDLLDLTRHSGTGSSHIGGELSLVEMLAVLFFHTLRLDPRDPEWSARSNPSAPDMTESVENREFVRKAMSELPGDYRKVLILKYVEENEFLLLAASMSRPRLLRTWTLTPRDRSCSTKR